MGGKRYERNHAAPLRGQFWGAFVGADPPEEVPAHPSGEMWMYAGTLPSSGYLGVLVYVAGPSHQEPGDEKSGRRLPHPFYNQYILHQPTEHPSL